MEKNRTAVYSIIVPLDFPSRVNRAKQVLRKNSNGAVLTYLMEQFEKSYAEEISVFERMFGERDITMEKPEKEEDLF